MFNISGLELLVILVVALLVLGPTRLPQAARSIGSLMRELRKMSTGVTDEIKQAMDIPGMEPETTTPSSPKPNRAYRPAADPRPDERDGGSDRGSEAGDQASGAAD